MKLSLSRWLFFATYASQALGVPARRDPVEVDNVASNKPLQDLVAWDQHSLIVRGERVFVMSGEFHPYRLPVPGLWLDVFQKIKAMGFNGVSFYTDWGLLEANPGSVITDGIWSLEEFFRAAGQAGIYLIARPGPYINAETSAGGIPGWVLRIKEVIRSNNETYLSATDNYMRTMGKIIADAQITNGGPVIIVQPENEYTTWPGVSEESFPLQMHREVMEYALQQLRDAGVVVPSAVNDNKNLGYFAPGTGFGAMDIYGVDAYPMRYDCNNPYYWPMIRFNWEWFHGENSPTTPFTIMEFQGGSHSGWGGAFEEKCSILVNHEAVRVVNKNNYGFGVKIFNIYMTYGGTNWGNLGFHGSQTSYDYGAAIAEDRQVWREKYSEEKLQANFLRVSPAYLTATPGTGMNGSYTGNKDIAVTPLFGNGTFYVVRHANFSSTETATYRLHVLTSIGNVTIPQLGGSLSLIGRDSKIHVTDYDMDGVRLVYSSAEVFTWAKGPGNKRTLLLYGGEYEIHELAVPAEIPKPRIIEGASIKVRKSKSGSSWIIHWKVTPTRRVLRAGDLEIHLLWRNDAYQHWPMELAAPAPISNYSSPSKDLAIIKGGYLIRSVSISGRTLALTGDLNATTHLELISAPRDDINAVTFNGKHVHTSYSKLGNLVATVPYHEPTILLPTLSDVEWRYIDSLPEIHSSYNDEKWTVLDRTETNNALKLLTPTCLYADDYGYHGGSLIYRGHFTGTGQESSVFLNVSGGSAFGYSLWLNDDLVGSYGGNADDKIFAQELTFPHKLTDGTKYILTLLIDHMGHDEEAPGTDAIKFPYGILDYSLAGHEKSDVTWKMTGNFGGEQYLDIVRGPMNEGAMYAERQGYHFPQPPTSKWKKANPIQDGLDKAGVGFYSTSFDLDLPEGYDIPLSFVFNNSAVVDPVKSGARYRCQLFVNGYQFGKYINNIGPQIRYPVPEGILNYNGVNYIAMTLWAFDHEGARIGSLDLVPSTPILSGYQKPHSVPQPVWQERENAY